MEYNDDAIALGMDLMKYQDRVEKLLKYKKFYDRVNEMLGEMADALPYLIDDMTPEERDDFIFEVEQKFNELKMEGEL